MIAMALLPLPHAPRGARPKPRLALLRRLGRSDRGALLVEFSIMLPLLILLFGVVVEGGRIMWSYQTAVAGVRDATRYLGRVVPSDLCETDATGATLAAYVDELTDRIENSISGSSVMPSMVTLSGDPGVQIEVESCTLGLRVPQVAIVEVTATVVIQLPFKEMLEVTGTTFPDAITTTIADKTRVFGA